VAAAQQQQWQRLRLRLRLQRRRLRRLRRLQRAQQQSRPLPRRSAAAHLALPLLAALTLPGTVLSLLLVLPLSASEERGGHTGSGQPLVALAPEAPEAQHCRQRQALAMPHWQLCITAMLWGRAAVSQRERERERRETGNRSL
jgi:hypothetical protein